MPAQPAQLAYQQEVPHEQAPFYALVARQRIHQVAD